MKGGGGLKGGMEKEENNQRPREKEKKGPQVRSWGSGLQEERQSEAFKPTGLVASFSKQQ